MGREEKGEINMSSIFVEILRKLEMRLFHTIISFEQRIYHVKSIE